MPKSDTYLAAFMATVFAFGWAVGFITCYVVLKVIL